VSNIVGIWDVMSHAARRPKISVVIPALNEERNLAYIASRLPHDVDEVVFVDARWTTPSPSPANCGPALSTSRRPARARAMPWRVASPLPPATSSS
jgi:hypothetical protein